MDKALKLHFRRLLDPEPIIGSAEPPDRLSVRMVIVKSIAFFPVNSADMRILPQHHTKIIRLRATLRRKQTTHGCFVKYYRATLRVNLNIQKPSHYQCKRFTGILNQTVQFTECLILKCTNQCALVVH